jgi:hypothetical protein
MGLQVAGDSRMARTSSKEAWTDLERTGHGEVFTVARKPDLREVWNSRATVANRRRGLVHWMRNNLTELTGALIYMVHQQCRPSWRNRVGGREEGMSHRGDLLWRSLDKGVRLLLVSLHGSKRHGQTAQGVARPNERWQPQRWSCGHVAGQVGTATGRNSAPSSSPMRYFLSCVVICTPPGTNRSAREDRGAESLVSRYSEPAIFFSVLYNQNSI